MAKHYADTSVINWEVRIKNKTFWITIIPAVILLIQAIGKPFGFEWDFGVLGEQLKAIVEAAFVVLTILGVVNDPTTATFADSALAKTYTKPKEK
jgi:phi LC3 family holin